ncbi:hypothetical protein ACVWXL_008918 [Bradyrhizobium sp. GM22.5]
MELVIGEIGNFETSRGPELFRLTATSVTLFIGSCKAKPFDGEVNCGFEKRKGVFARAAYAASKLGDFASALTFLEFGSARLLTMQLQLSRVAAETLKEKGHADLGDALIECMEEIAFCRRLAADSSWLETIAGAPHANYPIEQLRKAQQALSEVIALESRPVFAYKIARFM